MRKATWSIAVSAALSLAVLGCGSSSSNPSGTSSSQLVRGRVSADSPVTSVSLKAAGSPGAQTMTPAGGGEFSFDVAEIPGPYLLKAESASETLYAIATKPGVTNINPITTVVAVASSSEEVETSWSTRESRSSDDIERILKSLTTVLKPLFDLYGITRIDDDDPALRALLHDVAFTVKDRRVTVTNRATGGIIFTGRIRELSSGTFYPENMPAGPGGGTPSVCTGFTYNPWGACQSSNTQTRTVATSSPAGCTGGTPVVSQSCVYMPPPPAACQYTYTSWGACQSNGTQTRTVVTSGPTGCTGTPVALAVLHLRAAAGDLHRVHVQSLGRLPVEQHADTNGADVVPDGLHGRFTGPLAVLHLRAAGCDVQLVHLLGLGCLPVEQHPDPHGGDLVSCRLHGRFTGRLAVLHLRAAGGDLQFVHLLGLGRLPVEQHPDPHGGDLVSCRLHGWDSGPHPGVHLCAAGGDVQLVHLLGLGCLPVEQHPDPHGGDLVSCRAARAVRRSSRSPAPTCRRR